MQSFTIDLDDLPGFEGHLWYPTEAESGAALLWYANVIGVGDPRLARIGIREQLEALHALFDAARSLLRSHGRAIATAERPGDPTLAALTLTMLNEVVRPVTARWHPELLSHEEARPAHADPHAWERSWVHLPSAEAALGNVHEWLNAFADVLALAAGLRD